MRLTEKVVRRIGWLGFAAPFVALLLSGLWAEFAVDAYTLLPDLYVTSPLWWQRLGKSDRLWVEVGLLPGVFCGICGLVVVIAGVIGSSRATIAKGIWACIAAPVIILLYMAATF